MNTAISSEQARKIERHDTVLFGENGDAGVAHKVNIMWRAHAWLIGLLGAAGGYGFKWVVDTLARHT